jgi:lysozyme
MNDYQASDELIGYVKTTESLSLVPYVDIAGFTTWGYGHKARPGEYVPPAITQDMADDLLAADLNIAGAAVRGAVTVEMTQSQFDGLTDFTFNLGAGALRSSTMLSLFNLGNVEGAAQECKRWDHAHVGGHLVELAGLTARRHWDALHIAPSVDSVVWTPEAEIKHVEAVMPPEGTPVPEVIMPPQDGAVNIPTLTNEATPQQIEAAATPAVP